MSSTKKFNSHVRKYHKHYFFGMLGSFVAVKLVMLMFTGIGVVNYATHHETLADLEGVQFDAKYDVELGAEYISNTGVLAGVSSGVNISITNGRYRINTGSWTTTSGMAYSGDTLQLKIISSLEYNTELEAMLNLNTLPVLFSVTTKQEDDIVADEIILDLVEGAELATGYISNTGHISGINTGIISHAENCEYKINTGDWIREDSLVYEGDYFQIQVNAATGYTMASTGILFLGDLETSFIVVTKDAPLETGALTTGDIVTGAVTTGEIALVTGIIIEEVVLDSTIEAIKFANIVDAELASGYYSNAVVITGVNTGVTLNPSNLLYKVNTGLLTTDPGILYQGDVLQLYMISSRSYEHVQEGYVEIGTGKYSFAIGTKVEPEPELVIAREEETIQEELIQDSASGFVDTGDYAMFVVTRGSDFTGVVDTGTVAYVSSGGNLMKIFKTELHKYLSCKQKLNIREVEVIVDGDGYALLIPEFESKFLGNISALFSNLIVKSLNDNSLAESEIDEVLHNFNNFLVVLKLLRDDTEIYCQHSLSNYYINKFQNSLREYGIFGGEKK